MPPLQRRLWLLSAAATALTGALGLLVVTAQRLWAQGQISGHQVDLLNWVSFSGVVALCGLAVQWGQTRERMKGHGDRLDKFEQRVDDRFDRVERQIDALFEGLSIERRAQDRRDFGLRTDSAG